jgi:uncharacterized protein (TIGR02246 family)
MRRPEIVMPTSRRLLIAGSLLSLSVPAAAHTKSDEDTIVALLVAHTEKWNLHDIDAWAEILHDDADWVHWGGGYWRGKEQIMAGTKEIHRTYYRNSRMTPQRVEDLTFLASDIALAHVRSELTGDERSPGETFRYRKTALFTKKAGSWRIRALHNTRIRPSALAANAQ